MVVKEGYKNTEVGVIPEDWDCSVLGEKTIKIGSGITPRGGSSVYKEFGRPLVRSQNIGWGNLLLNDVAFIDDETHQTFQNTEINLNDVFLNISGASIGRSSFASAELVGGNVNQHVCIIRTIENQLNPVFLNLFLLSLKGQEQIDSYQSGGNRQGLNIGQIRTFKIPIPPLPEQKAIATVLSDTDNLIQALEKKIAKKELIKKGAMQQLLEPKEGWERKTLGEVARMSSGGTPSTTIDEYYNGDIIWISISDITKAGKYVSDSAKKLTEKGLLNSSAKVFPESTVLLAMYASIGKCCIALKEVSTSQAILGIEVNKNDLFNVYLYYFLLYNKTDLANQGQQGTQSNLNKGMVESLLVDLPPVEEQIHIAEIFTEMDNEIESLQEKLSKYKQLKQGLMQELLTGRIRLV